MKQIKWSLFFVLIVFTLCLCSEPQQFYPSFALTNFHDHILTWTSNQPNPTSPLGFPGVSSYRHSSNHYLSSALHADSFVFAVDGEMYSDPRLFEGPAFITPSGLVHEISHYNGTSLDTILADGCNLMVKRTIVQPPTEMFYIVTYNITLNGIRCADHSFSLLDFIITETLDCSDKLPFAFLEEPQVFLADLNVCGEPMFLATSPFVPLDTLNFQVASELDGSPTSPLFQFEESHGKSLQNATSAEATVLTVAILSTFPLNVETPTHSLSFFRALSTDHVSVLNTSLHALSRSPEYWEAVSDKDSRRWLDLAYRPPSTSLLFNTSLLTMRHGLNPSLGTFVASFHPSYQYKVWSRDASFAALIFMAANYTEEAEKILNWIALATPRDNNQGFHTCYSWWDGSVSEFVEPQYDSVGIALLAFYAHYNVKPLKSFFFNLWRAKIRALEDFLLDSVDPTTKLMPPDYSIWEESSDGRTGDPLPPSFFAFTQVSGTLGLYSAIKIEENIFSGETNNTFRITRLKQRLLELTKAIETHLYHENLQMYVRSLLPSMDQDVRIDSATSSFLWSGSFLNTTRLESHHNWLVKNLSVGAGVARYNNDTFFFHSRFNPGGQEVGGEAPPWGISTMMMLWAELVCNNIESDNDNEDNDNFRLQWMEKRAAFGAMPVGEAVDGDSTAYVLSSTPDLYEYAGVYIWSVLIKNGLTFFPDPHSWGQPI